MSWLARSIANSLRLDSDDDDDDDSNAGEDAAACFATPTTSRPPNDPQSINDDDRPIEYGKEEEEEEEGEDRFDGRGMKEDLSEFKDTITRQLWGVASFLIPPPQPPPLPPLPMPAPRINVRKDPNRSSLSDLKPWDEWEPSARSASTDHFDEEVSNSGVDSAFRSEFAGGSGGGGGFGFKSEDEIRGNAVGVTEEVLAFAKNIAHHPETWLDFPLSEEEDLDDFDMSEAQEEHAKAVECLTPRLAALRIELCPAHMSVGFFWMVYFVLLHSRLSKHDAELLSTQQIVQTRSMWMQELQKQTKPGPDWFGRTTFYSKEGLHEAFDHSSSHDAFSNLPAWNSDREPLIETEKHTVVSTEMPIIDKSVIEEQQVTNTRDKEHKTGLAYKMQVHDYDDDGDDWLHENLELDGYSGSIPFSGNEEDVSFSDLEDDINCTMPIKFKNISSLDTLTET